MLKHNCCINCYWNKSPGMVIPSGDLNSEELQVSRKHLQVRLTVSGVEARDVFSKYGTKIAGRTSIPGEWLAASKGQNVELGTLSVKFVVE